MPSPRTVVGQASEAITSSRLVHLAVVLLEAVGCPVPPKCLWNERGLRKLIRTWSQLKPGTIEELQAIAGLVDPTVSIAAAEATGSKWAVDLPRGQTALGIAPRARTIHIQVIWTRRELACHSAELASWLNKMSRWWLPLAYDDVRCDHGWSRAIAVRSNTLRTDSLPDTEFTTGNGRSMHYRRATAPATTVLSVQGTSRLRGPGMLVVADGSLNRFLSNAEPFVPVWQANGSFGGMSGPTEWIALQPTSMLAVLTKNVTEHLHGIIDGALRVAAPGSREGVFVFPLPDIVPAGGIVHIECRADSNGHPVEIFPNPVVFRAARCDYAYAQSGSYRTFRSWSSTSTIATSHTYETLIAGSDGISCIKQPQPFHSTLGDARIDCIRIADIERTLRRTFLGIRSVECHATCIWQPPRQPTRVLNVQLTTEPHSIVSTKRIKRDVFQELIGRLPVGVSLHVDLKGAPR